MILNSKTSREGIIIIIKNAFAWVRTRGQIESHVGAPACLHSLLGWFTKAGCSYLHAGT